MSSVRRALLLELLESSFVVFKLIIDLIEATFETFTLALFVLQVALLREEIVEVVTDAVDLVKCLFAQLSKALDSGFDLFDVDLAATRPARHRLVGQQLVSD